MIRGFFHARGGRTRPFVDAIFEFPMQPDAFEVRLLVDTGADHTVLAPLDAYRLVQDVGIDLTTLPKGTPSTGVGGRMETRTIDVVLTIDTFSTPLALTILEPQLPPEPLLPIPSLLGRDIISRFALIVEQRTNLVLLLTPDEADALNLPA